MFSNILLPIDLNHEQSWTKALPMAKGVLAPGGRLHVLGIVHDFGSALVAAHFPADFEAKALTHMKEALSGFTEANCGDVNVETHVGHGHVADRILNAASEVGADLIVMASHPPSDLRTLLVGSNADRVVHHAEVPVLVVR